MANFARVSRFRLEFGIRVARLPWVIFASWMSESEEKIGNARLPWVISASRMSESEEKTGFTRHPWIIFASGMFDPSLKTTPSPRLCIRPRLHRVAPNSLPGRLI